jgi:hypothetical protein
MHRRARQPNLVTDLAQLAGRLDLSIACACFVQEVTERANELLRILNEP